MDKKEQGRLLRAWRKHVGERQKRKISLMDLAAQVSEAAEKAGIPRQSRRIPGSHASMTRWELGDVEQSMSGLQLIATIYGVSVVSLMSEPPSGSAPTDDMVTAFQEFLETRKRT